MKKTTLLLAALAAVPAITFANTKLPTMCAVAGAKFQGHSLSMFSFGKTKPRLYAIKNIGTQPIWLTHGMSGGWDSQLSPNHWMSILVTDRHFRYGCAVSKPSGGMKKIDCSKTLVFCEFAGFTSKTPVTNGYLVTENVLFPALESKIAARGFVLPGQK